MLKFNSKKYHTYTEITAFLQQAAQEFPDYVTLESIGLSHQKRKIWLLSLTNKKTGSHADKPSLWVDGNTHASEVAGAQSCLYFIFQMLTQIKTSTELQFLLDHMNFYILPQVSPDGAEYFLQNRHEIRSSPKIWPDPELHENLNQKDINNDGEILLMRKEDSAGAFKKSQNNPEILVQRKAFDLPSKKQKYYKLYKEGFFQNYDGFTENQQSPYGLDFNRHFPGGYRPEGQQKGASSHPMASVEIRQFVEAFIAKHRIFGHIALHTYGGLILRPPATTPAEKFDLQDLSILKMIAEEAARVSGYQSLSTAEDFKYYTREAESGTGDDWSFEHRGVYSLTVEIWDIWKEAGIVVKDHVSRYFHPTEAETLKIFKWAKSKLALKDFYQPWKKFNHPQLGPVEIGGWKTGYVFRNPPPSLLKNEMQKVSNIILQFAKVLPLVHVKKSDVQKVDEKTKKLILVTENQGFLPTNGSHQAIRMQAVTKPTVTLKTTSKLKLISHKKHFETAHLQGRNNYVPFHSPISGRSGSNTEQSQFEWFFQGTGTLEITFDYQRGGVIRHQVEI